MEDLIKRFDVDLSGRIEFGNGEFLGVIASIAVTSVHDIDDFVFSAAFRTFDHVSVKICNTDQSTIIVPSLKMYPQNIIQQRNSDEVFALQMQMHYIL